jgi:phosphate:Na+ symporter
MCELLNAQYELVKSRVLDENYDITPAKIEEYEDMIDDMRRNLVAEHIDRLKQGKCKPENNTIFINLVSNLERIGDHLYYIVR